MFLSASLSSVNERSPLVDCSSLTRLVTVTSSVICADLERQRAGREPVVRVDDDVGPLERLEALQGDLQRVGVGADDGKTKRPSSSVVAVSDVALRAAGQRDGDARQHASLGVLHRAGHGCARRLRVEQGRDAARTRARTAGPICARSPRAMDISFLPSLRHDQATRFITDRPL